jgi:tRNA(Leu) C34 or U34 (ribose-2'-O)-methylase TrmL
VSATILLINPKNPYNVAGAVRACASLGGEQVFYTGKRIKKIVEKWTRIPREERMFAVRLTATARPLEGPIFTTRTPVAVEYDETFEPLTTFQHPDDAVYVFGPEDGGLSKGMLGACHRHVRIPSEHCLNLAAAVNVVLYDRRVKRDGAGT